MRELCEKCKTNPKAINYKKGDKIFYRRLCDSCLIQKKKKVKPQWQQEGYKKKFKCESCGFIAKHSEQLTVCEHTNIWRTVCLNCEIDFQKTGKLDIKKDLKSDF